MPRSGLGQSGVCQTTPGPGRKVSNTSLNNNENNGLSEHPTYPLLYSWHYISQSGHQEYILCSARVQEGHCIRLYTEWHYNKMLEYQLPEILRTPLEELILQIKVCMCSFWYIDIKSLQISFWIRIAHYTYVSIIKIKINLTLVEICSVLLHLN